MRHTLFGLLALGLVVSGCGEKPAPEAPEKAEIQGLLDPPEKPAPREQPSPKQASDFKPFQLVEALRQAYSVPEDKRSMEDIRNDGMLPETRAVMDRCVEEMRFSGAVETACIGLALPDCPGMAGTTSDMVACNGMEYEYWDERLNIAYNRLLDLLREEDKELVDDGPYPVSLENAVKGAQRKWIAFRDAQCEYAYGVFRGGTMGRITGSSCMRVLTAKRAIELEQMMSNHDMH